MAFVTVGCDAPSPSAQKEGPAESAGQKLDRAAKSAGDKVDRTADQIAADAKEAAAKTVAVLDDASLTAKVKGALIAEPGLKTLQIEVSTKDGVVTLNGSVDTPVLKKRAVEIAGSLSGVREVVDQLVVKSS
jgi:osmotically-inducible protein OsmY